MYICIYAHIYMYTHAHVHIYIYMYKGGTTNDKANGAKYYQ